MLKDKILKAEQYYNFNKEKIIGHCFDVDIYSKNDIFLYRHYQRIEIPYSLILNTLHHQGIIIKNSYIKKYNYPTFTKTYSDYSLLLNIYNKKLKLKFHNNSIAKFQLGGKSSNSKIIYWIESSKLRFKYLNLIYALFFSIMHFFINLIFIKDLFFKKKMKINLIFGLILSLILLLDVTSKITPLFLLLLILIIIRPKKRYLKIYFYFYH